MSQLTWDHRDVRSRVLYYGSKGSWHVYSARGSTYYGRVGSLRSGRGWMARTPSGELVSGIAFRSRKVAAIALRNHHEAQSNP